MPFESPNYTQVPNDLFDRFLSDMSEPELKVVLAILRATLGYHHDEVKLSLTELVAITGLSEGGVIIGARAGELSKLIQRETVGRKKTTWRALISTSPREARTTSRGEVALPHGVRQSTSPREVEGPSPYIDKKKAKESIKKEKKEEGASAPAHTPSPFMDHPAVVLYREVFLLTPNPVARKEISEQVTDLERWRGVLDKWRINKHKPTNIADMLDAYRRSNGNGKNNGSGAASSRRNQSPEQLQRDLEIKRKKQRDGTWHAGS